MNIKSLNTNTKKTPFALSRFRAFALLCVFLTSGIIFGTIYRTSPNRAVNIERFQKELHAKEALVFSTLHELHELLADNSADVLINFPFPDNEISYYVVENGELIFWSDNQLDISGVDMREFSDCSHFIHLANAYCVVIAREYDGLNFIALITIKYDYPYENNRLINRFARGFDMDKRVGITAGDASDKFPVFCKSGHYLFSLVKPGTAIYNEFWALMASIAYGLAFLLFFLMYARFPLFVGKKNIDLKTFFALFFSVGMLVGALLYFDIPKVFLQNKLFCSTQYASNVFLSSICHLSILTAFVFASACLFFFFVRIEKKSLKTHLTLLLLYPIYFLALYSVLNGLVFHSNIQLNILRPNDFSIIGVWAHFLLIVWGVGLALIFHKTHRYFAAVKKLRLAVMVDLFCVGLLIVASFFVEQISLLLVVLPFVLISIGFYVFIGYKKLKNSYLHLLVWASLYAFFVAFNLVELNAEKDKAKFRVLAQNIFATDNLRSDQIADILFEDLDERLTSETIMEFYARLQHTSYSFPDLLISASANIHRQLNVSVAKYENQSLIYSSGTVNFPFNTDWIPEITDDSDYTVILGENRWHYVYKPNAETLVIVSRLYRNSFSDYVQFFVYLAFIYFVFGWLLTRFYLYFYDKENYRLGLVARFQAIFISLLIASFVGIFYISINFITENYKRQQIENLRNLRTYIQSALQYRYYWNQELNAYNTPYLNFDLQDLSYTYQTDIHVFDNNGILVGSSQPLIFYRNLISNRMSPKVFFSQNSNMVQYERIGELSYLTAYTDFYNGDFLQIGYIAVPQFFSEEAMRAEIENFSSVIIHVYFFIILITILLTVLIGRKFSKPLNMLEHKLKAMRIGHRNEKIDYQYNDEIGQLVTQYNHTVDELEQSAKLLAKSERESAWKLMARQIAHEINNPLTPMKLSIQQLQRRKGMNDDGFDEYFKNTTSMLIEQIDNLSRIAGTFSDFARMPEANYAQVDISVILQSVARLFANNNQKISIHCAVENSVFIYADSEQLIQVFNNLIKNAVQSIPKDRKGKVEISLEQTENSIVVRISDNGNGVPKEIQDKMFVPNFTTKAQGMGLGLAISKNIIEQLGGNIRFETKEKKGSVFIVEIPKKN